MRSPRYINMTSSNGNIFRVSGSLTGESTGHSWIALTKANNADFWCFLWSALEQTVEQTIETSVIWDTISLIMTSMLGILQDTLPPTPTPNRRQICCLFRPTEKKKKSTLLPLVRNISIGDRWLSSQRANKTENVSNACHCHCDSFVD